MPYDIGMTPAQLAAITDVQTLHGLVLEKLDEIARRQRDIDALTLEVARLRGLRFAAKTETLNAVQRGLFEDAVDEEIGAAGQVQAQADDDSAREKRRRKPGPRREALPAHLPRETQTHEPASCTCPQCRGALSKIGEHVSEKLAVKPLAFYVKRDVYPQYACRACETVVAEPVPAAIIDRGQAAPSLLAQVVIGKYADHLPLYRQQAQYLRAGVELARSTLAEWVGAVGVVLEPLLARLRERLHAQVTLHADETPVRTLDPGSGKTLRSYLFAYRSTAGPPMVMFDYAEGRSGKYAQAFLGSWRGALMVDDYAGYKALFAQGVTELACWVHVRRKFVEVAQHSDSPLAHEAVRRIAELYRIEAEAADLAPAARTLWRQTHAGPVLASLHAWLTEVSHKHLGGSTLAKAVNHALGRWPALLRYLDDGAYPIDNNPIENAIRPIALGRKNWLFVGSTRAGPRAAAIMSLIATAKANGLCPHAWLTDVLTRLPSTKQRDIDTLLPIAGWQPLAG